MAVQRGADYAAQLPSMQTNCEALAWNRLLLHAFSLLLDAARQTTCVGHGSRQTAPANRTPRFTPPSYFNNSTTPPAWHTHPQPRAPHCTKRGCPTNHLANSQTNNIERAQTCANERFEDRGGFFFKAHSWCVFSPDRVSRGNSVANDNRRDTPIVPTSTTWTVSHRRSVRFGLRSCWFRFVWELAVSVPLREPAHIHFLVSDLWVLLLYLVHSPPFQPDTPSPCAVFIASTSLLRPTMTSLTRVSDPKAERKGARG